MNFSVALNLLKNGKKLKRRGWNGKNQYIELVNVSSITPYSSGSDTIDDINCKCVAIFNESNVQVGWVCSQADLLAEDWEVFDENSDEYSDFKSYKDVIESGTCNDCDRTDCKYKPDVGELTRFNCPFHTRQVDN